MVTFNENFRSRADAVLLVGTLRKLTREAAVVLLSALRDVPEVQYAAELAIDRFRYIDPEALELLLAEIDPSNDSATAVYGAARLLGTLARSDSLNADQRQAVTHRLARALRDPGCTRRGVYLMTGSGGKDEKAFRIRFQGRLGDELYETLIQTAGGALQLRPVRGES